MTNKNINISNRCNDIILNKLNSFKYSESKKYKITELLSLFKINDLEIQYLNSFNPPTPYELFFKLNKDKILSKLNVNISNSNVHIDIETQWKSLNDSEKKKFIDESYNIINKYKILSNTNYTNNKKIIHVINCNNN